MGLELDKLVKNTKQENLMSNIMASLKSVLDNKYSLNFKYNSFELLIDKESLLKVVKLIRDSDKLKFNQLIDITAVDYPEKTKRFDIVYHFLSMTQNHRIRVKLAVSDTEIVPSICAIHRAANWYEREVFDMYGISFSGHPDLRRILTDYGFQGYPLRKDFPTTGYTEVRYDDEKKKVVYEPVALTQEYRQFDFLSPWEGAAQMELDVKAEVEEDIKK